MYILTQGFWFQTLKYIDVLAINTLKSIAWSEVCMRAFCEIRIYFASLGYFRFSR